MYGETERCLHETAGLGERHVWVGDFCDYCYAGKKKSFLRSGGGCISEQQSYHRLRGGGSILRWFWCGNNFILLLKK